MSELVERINFWGSQVFYPPGWDGLAEYVKHWFGGITTSWNVSDLLFHQRLDHIDWYSPLERRRGGRYWRDHLPAGAI